MKKRILSIICLLLGTLTYAQENDEPPGPPGGDARPIALIDGLQYRIDSRQHVVTVDDGNSWVGELVIPEQVTYNGETYTVNSMKHGAFNLCNTLIKVRIPKTVVNVWDYAMRESYMNPFAGCTSLECIEVDEENPMMCSVDGVLFSADTTMLYAYPAGATAQSYSVPTSVGTVKGDAFSRVQLLKELRLPASVTTIYADAFSGCERLEKVVLPAGLVDIPQGLFRDCKSLKDVSIPLGVTSIGGYAFYGCESLPCISLPEGVTSVGALAFMNCVSLREADLPPTLSEIPQAMFKGCSSLLKMTILPNVTTVSHAAFMGCTSLRNLDIPQGVTYIGSEVFSGCRFDTLVIRGAFESLCGSASFYGMDESSVVYVQASELGKFRSVYHGKVFPISDYNPSGLSTFTAQPTGATQVYGLQGRRLRGKPVRGLYIEQGRKRVVR